MSDTTMRCDILLFAQLRESLGTDRMTIDVPHGATVREALNLLMREHEPIAALRGRLAVAVNDRYASLGEAIPDGAELALIPPVSGG